MISPDKIKEKAKLKEAEHRKFLNRLKVKRPRDLDQVTAEFHAKAFEQINCLDCGNCCKTLGPRLTLNDIDRLVKFVGIKPEKFIDQYLRIDEDGDYVFKSMPCPFLAADNYCMVYEKRPKACAEYPHTDRRKFHQLLDITLKNSFTCPAVYEVVESLKKFYS